MNYIPPTHKTLLEADITTMPTPVALVATMYRAALREYLVSKRDWLARIHNRPAFDPSDIWDDEQIEYDRETRRLCEANINAWQTLQTIIEEVELVLGAQK